MKILLGTKAPPKVKAIESAIKKCIYFKDKDVVVEGYKVDSGISDMPTSLEENIAGAKNRSQNVSKLGTEADFYIGMEGGTNIIGDKSYLFGAVYILDNKGAGSLGLSPMMQVPDYFHKKIYDEGGDLGPILSEVTGIVGASQQNGAFGHWSDDMLTRQDQFELAFTAAIVPFFNKYYK